MRSILFLFFLLIVSSAKSQTPAENWKTGYYYATTGEKISGLINYKPYYNVFMFKNSQTASPAKIKIAQVRSLVIPSEADSVTVITESNNENKKYFAGAAITSPTAKFYYKLKAEHKGGLSLHADTYNNLGSLEKPAFDESTPNFTESSAYIAIQKILMYEKDKTTFEITKSNFKDILGNAFADDAKLSADVKSGNYKFTDLPIIVGTYQQYQNTK